MVKRNGESSPLPVPDVLTGATEYTKQCFWINSDYILDVIEGKTR